MSTITTDFFIKIKNSVNGNPRYIISSNLVSPITAKLAGGKLYMNGQAFVFEAHNLGSAVEIINQKNLINKRYD